VNPTVVEISPETRDFVRQLNDFSAHKLTHQDDVAVLLELTRTNNLRRELEEIAFLAKFLSNTHTILKRSSNDADGYNKLSQEFRSNLEKVVAALRGIVAEAPSTTREVFSSRYFSVTAEGFENLINLLYDLSWLKNWIIDKRPFG